MKLLVIGKAGQVARALRESDAPAGFTMVAEGRPDLDMLHPKSMSAALDRQAPDLVINAAAYTAVDAAEADAVAATALNARAAADLARETATRSIPLIHISTDYVFDGASERPYREDDPVSPLGVYGRSKLEGERAVAELNPRHLIVRTAWVYSPFGKNFVKTMLRLAETRDEVSVVADQIGNPTSAHAFAETLLMMALRVTDKPDASLFGVYHASGSGHASWADLARHVFSVSASLGGPHARVKPIPTSEYPTPVTRPANSRLDCSKLQQTFGHQLPTWQDSTTDVITRLIKEESYSS
ncbi:MAG: dTDP-4-dehydrorhamnose reductase [Alphaproteobacteria bacterium]|nr:dTDP-4-dehydrorhamnose reductase [Alphaproteobacteria bacterium]MBU2082822.1 dTDP-4-dehydrorhamnose reductase [Alphaproteobacteria bacterium]MBU2142994.1 dTDP-4-dehydrorhamnose reductase [Alphaproteobacteria bacterium]MBU2196588.1 dTDP-4-dehydrorhamnose reductase [Alphaproteobacteria bacterium]